jgi:GR25 family glycosyltransferase involved in LPS biosynthesis
MDQIDGIVYINLEKRKDRFEHMQSLLQKYNINALRFNAIEHEYGLYACGLSHLAVLKMAKNAGWNRVLILEDDILITVDPEKFHSMIQTILQRPFDVCMLDLNLQSSEPIDDILSIVKVKCAYCAGAYIVENHYYQILIDLYESCLPKLLETRYHWMYANDAAWHSLQVKDNWIAYVPQICKQMSGYSDTKNMVI